MSESPAAPAQPASSVTPAPVRPNTDATTQTLFAADPTMLETRMK